VLAERLRREFLQAGAYLAVVRFANAGPEHKF